MKSYLVTFFLFFIGFNTVSAQELTVMTYNIRLDVASDKENAWPQRKGFLASQILFLEPDILGVQEALPHQVAELKLLLKNYKFIGIGREGGDKGEYSGIFYNAKKIAVEQDATFWLSENPDQVSKGWDAVCERVSTYALFTLKDSKKKIWVFNTHLDHIGVKARQKGITLILDRINSLNSTNLDIILMGDLNVEEDDKVIQDITKVLDDSRKKAEVVLGPEGTFNAFKYHEPALKRIDYIMVSKNIAVQKYATFTTAINSKFPSDHFPVFVKLQLKY